MMYVNWGEVYGTIQCVKKAKWEGEERQGQRGWVQRAVKQLCVQIELSGLVSSTYSLDPPASTTPLNCSDSFFILSWQL
jgi:hypothetical protein